MSQPAALTQESPLGDVEVTTSDVERVERALIDASTRLPVLVFYASAIAWLLVATLFGVLTSFKMHVPGFLGDVSFLRLTRTSSRPKGPRAFSSGAILVRAFKYPPPPRPDVHVAVGNLFHDLDLRGLDLLVAPVDFNVR